MVDFDYLVSLVQRIEQKHDELIRRVYSSFRICPSDAEDCLQEAHLRLTKASKENRLDSNREGFGYFFTALKSACVDYLRSRKRRKDSNGLEEQPYISTKTRTPLDDIVNRSDLEEVKRAIDSMPQIYADISVLRFVEGLGRAEIAERLHLTPNAASVRINRAKKILRERFIV